MYNILNFKSIPWSLNGHYIIMIDNGANDSPSGWLFLSGQSEGTRGKMKDLGVFWENHCE